MKINILVTGDIHIGKRSSAVSGDDRQLATKHTWKELVAYAIDKRMDVVVLLGDIVDHDNRFFEAANPLLNGLRELNDSGIEVFVIAGNHDFDVLPQLIGRESFDRVHFLGKDKCWESHRYETEGEAVQFIGWSFPDRHYGKDPLELLDGAVIDKSIPTIALVHGDAYNPSEKDFAPLNTERMKACADIDAWLIGHIHRPDVISEQHPLILYPGSLHALSPKEEGVHGPFTLTVDGRNITLEQQAFSPVRYESLQIDISGAEDKDAVRNRIVEQINKHSSSIAGNNRMAYLVYDLILYGNYSNFNELNGLKAELSDFEGLHPYAVSIRKINIDAKPALNIKELDNDPSYIGVLANAILLLERGESNRFIDGLVENWMQKYHTLALNNVYHPLRKMPDDDELHSQARQSVLRECKNLIAQLTYSRDYEV